MKQVSHYDKVMWSLYCEYSYLKPDTWFVLRPKYEWNGETKTRDYAGEYKKWHERTSAEQWSFIHSKYYQITKVEPIYEGTLQDFVEYLRPVQNSRWKNPYNYKKNGYGFRWANKCGRNRYRWGHTSGERTKEQKKPEHVEKKILSEEEIHKREWKKKKNRSKKKSYWQWARKKNYVTKGNRSERRHVKQLLGKSDFKYSGKSSTWWDVKHCTGHDYNGECIKEIFEWNPPKDDWDTYYDKGRRSWVNPWDWD